MRRRRRKVVACPAINTEPLVPAPFPSDPCVPHPSNAHPELSSTPDLYPQDLEVLQDEHDEPALTLQFDPFQPECLDFPHVQPMQMPLPAHDSVRFPYVPSHRRLGREAPTPECHHIDIGRDAPALTFQPDSFQPECLDFPYNQQMQMPTHDSAWPSRPYRCLGREAPAPECHHIDMCRDAPALTFQPDPFLPECLDFPHVQPMQMPLPAHDPAWPSISYFREFPDAPSNRRLGREAPTPECHHIDIGRDAPALTFQPDSFQPERLDFPYNQQMQMPTHDSAWPSRSYRCLGREAPAPECHHIDMCRDAPALTFQPDPFLPECSDFPHIQPKQMPLPAHDPAWPSISYFREFADAPSNRRLDREAPTPECHHIDIGRDASALTFQPDSFQPERLDFPYSQQMQMPTHDSAWPSRSYRCLGREAPAPGCHHIDMCRDAPALTFQPACLDFPRNQMQMAADDWPSISYIASPVQLPPPGPTPTPRQHANQCAARRVHMGRMKEADSPALPHLL